jgi:two-component system chemotaxis sensor kinase CheA
MLTPILAAAGYAVTAVESASEALSKIAAGERFDVVVTDLDMPDMSGFELAQSLQTDPITAAIPVIGLTPIDSPETAHFARQVGIRECVAKFDRPALVAVLEANCAMERAA